MHLSIYLTTNKPSYQDAWSHHDQIYNKTLMKSITVTSNARVEFGRGTTEFYLTLFDGSINMRKLVRLVFSKRTKN